MIRILYTRFQQQLNEIVYRQYMSTLPRTIQSRIARFHFWQDAHRSLFGNLLLIHGLEEMQLLSLTLEDLRYTIYNRPYLQGVDFNISHSGAYVICAISVTNQVGIDVEEIKEIPAEEFTGEFSAAEIAAITEDKTFRHFYTLWTQKEAFLKAIGKGLSVPLNQVSVNGNNIRWENKDWYLHEVKLDAHHVSHLCTDSAAPDVILREVIF